MFLRRIPTATACLILMVCHPARASESDSFTRRYEPVADASPRLNRKMNQLLAQAVREANRWGIGCSESVLEWELVLALKGNVVGSPIEEAILEDGIPHIPAPPLDASIFRGVSAGDGAFVLRWFRAAFVPTVRMRVAGVDIIVGADKFGHFLTQGLAYFRLVSWLRWPLERVLRRGLETEKGRFGHDTTGTFSYADLYANWMGLRFWLNTVERRVADAPGPYFECRGRRWEQVLEFRWEHYVDAAWDEGVNCNSYTERVRAHVAANIRALERAQKRRLACPVEPGRLDAIRARLGRLGSSLLHP